MKDDDHVGLRTFNNDGTRRGACWMKVERVAFGTRLPRDVIRLAKAQTRQSGEYLNQFLARLIREEFERKPVPLG
jgi:hypothetical protein